MEINGAKASLKFADEINKQDKKSKKINKVKDDGIIVDKSITNNAENISVNNIHISLPIEEINKKLGLAQSEISQEFKKQLRGVKEEILTKALEEITPLFIATHLNKDFAEEQKNIVTDITWEKSLRKQSLSKINLLTRKDISLLGLIYQFDLLVMFISKKFLPNKTVAKDGFNGSAFADIMDQLNLSGLTSKITNVIAEYRKYSLLYGTVTYKCFENLRVNQLVSNNGNTNTPLVELVFKMFYNKIDDTSLNEEYINDDEKMKKNRKKWSNHFIYNKFTQSPEIQSSTNQIIDITNWLPNFSYYTEPRKDGAVFWELSSVGKYLGKILINKSDKENKKNSAKK